MSLGQIVLFRQLLVRDIRSRFVGSVSGWLWVVITPLLLLGVYGFVFGVIFRARVPEGLDMPFVAWLATALWPWLAFSEGVLRGSQSILQHSALVSKVALRRELLVIASVTSVFILHMAGYAAVLIVLKSIGVPVHLSGIPSMILTLLTLYLLTLGLGLALAAIQVFIRDLEQALPTLFMFWFFLTPILYAPEMLPDRMARFLEFNPLTWWMGEIRNALLMGQDWPTLVLVVLATGAIIVLWLGLRLFRRLSPYFEDFL